MKDEKCRIIIVFNNFKKSIFRVRAPGLEKY